MTTSGRLLVDKDSGPTSHDVVARVRRLLGERRVGHAGTLDPLASGLLVIAVGPATRLLRFAQAGFKTYEGRARLGVATDSLDAQGAVVAEAAVPVLHSDELAAAAAALTGRQLQRPPMVSAVKVGGRRLHELARQGIEVERAAREIVIEEFTLEATAPDELAFRVRCSAGTYVRVLLGDLAERLGTVGHLVALRRVASGAATVTEAHSLTELEERASRGEELLEPALRLVEGMDQRFLTPEEVRRVRQGQRLAAQAGEGEWVAALDPDGALVAVLARRGEALAPEVVLAGADPAGR